MVRAAHRLPHQVLKHSSLQPAPSRPAAEVGAERTNFENEHIPSGSFLLWTCVENMNDIMRHDRGRTGQLSLPGLRAASDLFQGLGALGLLANMFHISSNG